jgi:hypothetical protein
VLDTIIAQLECESCGGECCDEVRIHYVVPKRTTLKTAPAVLAKLGLPDVEVLGVRTDEYGDRVVNIRCPRRGHCDPETRPERCRLFPLMCLEPDYPAQALADTAEFCALLRRLIAEREG